MTDEIHFEHIKIKELHEFAERVLGAAKPGQFVPITMQRALAHANNPYAAKDDVALLVAIDGDDEVVGYFGILPLLLRNGEELFKTYWFTTWSVSPKVRGRGVGAQLMAEALSLKQDYLIVGSVHARRVCRKYGFWERPPLTYYWLDTTGMGHLNPLIWLRRFVRKLYHILGIDKTIELRTPLADRIDRLCEKPLKNLFFALLKGPQSNVLTGAQVRAVEQISGEPTTPPHAPPIELHRAVDAVNWMLKYPWVVENGHSVTEEMNYFFSDARPLYRLIPLEIHSTEGDQLGFVVLSASQKGEKMVLRVLDTKFSNPADHSYILALAIQYAREYSADTIELPLEAVKEFRGTLLGRMLLHKKERIYQCMPSGDDSPLAEAWEDIHLKLVDGDMAFS
jgi:GNAT superfamily N-acetyltransferase